MVREILKDCGDINRFEQTKVCSRGQRGYKEGNEPVLSNECSQIELFLYTDSNWSSGQLARV